MTQVPVVDRAGSSPAAWAMIGTCGVALGGLLGLVVARLPLSALPWSGWLAPPVLAPAVAWWIGRPQTARLLGREAGAAAGVWFTSKARRLANIVPALAAALAMIYAFGCVVPAFSRAHDVTGLVLSAGCAVLFAGLLAHLIRHGTKRHVELRIDEAGVYCRRWGGTLAWTAINRVVAVGRDDQDWLLLLEIGPNTLAGVKAATRRSGGIVGLDLAAAGLSATDAICALRARRPELAGP